MRDDRAIKINKTRYTYDACMKNTRQGLLKKVDEAMENIVYLRNAIVHMTGKSLEKDKLITRGFPSIDALIEEARGKKVHMPRLLRLGEPNSSTQSIAQDSTPKRHAPLQAAAPASKR